MTVLDPVAEAELSDHRDRQHRARQVLGVDGVDGVEHAEPLRAMLRAHGVSLYPVSALGLLLLVDGFQGTAFTVVTPDLQRTLGISLGALLGARTLTFIATVLSPLPFAALSNSRVVRSGRVGRAMICIVTGIVWSLITLTTGFVTSLLALIGVLVFDGLSSGSVAALHTALLADSYPPRARVRVFSLYAQFNALGAVLSPLLVSLLAGPLDLTWRGVFLALGGLSLVGTFVSFGLRDPGPGRFDTEAIRSQSLGETDHVDLRFFEIVRRLLLIPSVQRILTGFAVFGVLSIPLGTVLSTFLYDHYRLGTAARGLFFAGIAATTIVGLVVWGRRGEREFSKDPGELLDRAGQLLAAGVVLVVVGALVGKLALSFVFIALGQACITIVNPSLSAVGQSIVDARYRPHLAALLGLFTASGAVFGTLFLSSINQRFGITGSLVSLIVPGVVGALIVRSARLLVAGDMDRMIESLLEEQDLATLHDSGGRLPMLACRGLSFSYGPLQVLFDVDFTVDQGEMVALLGTNGAGKSTLLKVVSGIGLPQSGSVRMNGHDITYLDAERRLRLGITQIPGGRAVFGPLNVIDNLRCFGYTLGSGRRTVEDAIDRCLAAFPRLEERKASAAATLSGGEQQMLGLSKALMLKPRLLLIDELSLGLAPVIVSQLLDMVREINAEGTAVVLVEQSVNIALSVVDHAYFMEKGQMRFDGAAADLLGRDDLLRAVFLEGATKGTRSVADGPTNGRPRSAARARSRATGAEA